MVRQNARTIYYHPPPQSLPDDIKTALYNRKSKSGRKRFSLYKNLLVAAVGIIVLLLFQVLFQHGNEYKDEIEIPLSTSGLSELESANSRFEKEPTAVMFDDMLNASVRAGELLELSVLHVVTANEQPPNEGIPLTYNRTLMESTGESVQIAADNAYEHLKKIVADPFKDNFDLVPEELPRRLFRWITSTAYIYNGVLVEYYLFQDSSYPHAVSLIRSINALDWLSFVPKDVLGWSTTPCQSTHKNASAIWMKFCETSCVSPSHIATRQAAAYEELIALYPQYGPFRLHYLTLWVLGDIPFPSRDSIAQVIQSQRKTLNARNNVEAFYGNWLDLLEICELPPEHLSVEKVLNVRQLSRKILESCDSLMFYHVIDSNNSKGEFRWPGTFSKEIRPPLLTKNQLRRFLKKLSFIFEVEEGTMVNALRDCL